MGSSVRPRHERLDALLRGAGDLDVKLAIADHDRCSGAPSVFERLTLCCSIDLFGWHRRSDHHYPQREALLAGPEYQCGGLGASVAASLTVFCCESAAVLR
jgi:hypothetical protein